MQNISLGIVTFSRAVENFSIYFSIFSSVCLYQSFTQLSLCWACDWRGWQPGLYLALQESASFHALIAVITGNRLWVITNNGEFFFTVNSWTVVSPSGILREPNWRSMGQSFFNFARLQFWWKHWRRAEEEQRTMRKHLMSLFHEWTQTSESEFAFEDSPLNKAITHLIFRLQSRLWGVNILLWTHVQRSTSF